MSHWNKDKRKNLYNPSSEDAFKISRSKIDLYLECRKCFYLDRRFGIGRPDMPGFSLNSAVDGLLKKEFDLLRQNGESHALMKEYGLDLVPFKHPEMDVWRENFKGKEYFHKETNLVITGAIDDIWVDKKGKLHIVDYKSTSTSKVISLDDQYKLGYKKQMEIYQWIFRRSGFEVSDTGYFVFANALKTPDKFDGKLSFALSIISHKGDDSWVKPLLFEIRDCLVSNVIPKSSEKCEYCKYRKEVSGYDSS